MGGRGPYDCDEGREGVGGGGVFECEWCSACYNLFHPGYCAPSWSVANCVQSDVTSGGGGGSGVVDINYGSVVKHFHDR